MDGNDVINDLVTRRLQSCATLTAMVASQSIKVGSGRPATTMPAIRLRVVAGRGRRPKSVLVGDVYINVYSNSLQPAGQLALIYNVVYQRLSASVAAMTTTHGAVSMFDEENKSYPLYDEQEAADRYYLTSRYRFTGQNRTLL